MAARLARDAFPTAGNIFPAVAFKSGSHIDPAKAFVRFLVAGLG
jgi:hypothetical protein